MQADAGHRDDAGAVAPDAGAAVRDAGSAQDGGSVQDASVPTRDAGPAGVCTTGWLMGNAFEDRADVGTRAWDLASNVRTSDNMYAITGGLIPRMGELSHYLVARDFRPGLATGTVIRGIEVEIERSGLSGSGVVDERVSLVRASGIGAHDAARPDVWLRGDMNITYGGATDTWEETLTGADVNAAEFGVALQIGIDGVGDFPQVDAIRVAIHHDCP